MTTETRQQRGLEIAARFKITQRNNGTWVVPSQNGGGKYTVVLDPKKPKCSCPDHETRGYKCKHIYAVEYTVRGVLNTDGSGTVTETLTVTETVKRKTYPQKWSAYNAAQTSEKAQFQLLLRDLCRTVSEPFIKPTGRPRLPIADAVFSVAFKVYSTFSGRRFIPDLCDANDKGYISRVPHFNSIFNYLEWPDLSPILTDLITQSSLPLATVETDFSVDSSGFGSSRFVTWYHTKYGHEQDNHDWVKTHLCCGVKTNVVTAVKISGRFDHDSPFLPELVKHTAKNFTLSEVSADKGYSSRGNLMAIATEGAVPFVAFKKSALPDRTGKAKVVKDTLWTRMYYFYKFKGEEFLAHYHKRSNVESTMMMIKAKFGDAVRSRTDVAQANEVLCKVLCHNICCLIQSAHELGIDPAFGQGDGGMGMLHKKDDGCTKTMLG